MTRSALPEHYEAGERFESVKERAIDEPGEFERGNRHVRYLRDRFVVAAFSKHENWKHGYKELIWLVRS